jgi:hypothetical protein
MNTMYCISGVRISVIRPIGKLRPKMAGIEGAIERQFDIKSTLTA